MYMYCYYCNFPGNLYHTQIYRFIFFTSLEEIQTVLEDQRDPIGAADEAISANSFKYYPDDHIYIELMENILTGYPHLAFSHKPSQVFNHVWVGSIADAENLTMLAKYKITHLLCVHGEKRVDEKPIHMPKYPSECSIKKARVFPCYDTPHFNILNKFPEAFVYLDNVRRENGNVLIYSKGVSCSGAIAIGYMMMCGLTLLMATRKLKHARHVALTNPGFIRLLVKYGRMKGLLDPNPAEIKVRKFGSAADRSRILATVI